MQPAGWLRLGRPAALHSPLDYPNAGRELIISSLQDHNLHEVHFYGSQALTEFAGFSLQMWRGLVAEYLRKPLHDGRRLLLILDGLDGTAWRSRHLLPLILLATTGSVASARYLGGERTAPSLAGSSGVTGAG